MTVRKATKRKKPAKKLSRFDKPMVSWETHTGTVAIALQDQVQKSRACCNVPRDEALLFAMDLMVASSGLSRKEVAQHFSK